MIYWIGWVFIWTWMFSASAWFVMSASSDPESNAMSANALRGIGSVAFACALKYLLGL